MRLWELPDQYVLEPTDGSSPSQCLAISRVNGDISTLGHVPSGGANQRVHTEEVYGVAGIIRLLAGAYVPVITGRQEVGVYRGSPVFRVTALQFLCCNQKLGDLSPEEIRDEAHYMSLLKEVESTSGLFFSYDTDLTLNAQAAIAAGSKLHRLPLHQQAESRFLWNRFLLQEFIEAKLESFILPIIQGSFQSAQSTVNDRGVKLTIISRRCMRRVGTRMWRRGADSKGNVANFVETEQIIEAANFFSSYVQVRGSIPILWEQIVDLSYKPTITDLNLEATPNAVKRHFQDLHTRYGDVMALDLINQQGSEGVLSVAFAKAMEKITSDSIRYVPFDFHHICGQLNFARLSDLYDGLSEHLSRQSYFMTDSDDILQEQKGIVRTNCIDCLDRTNVTQSMLARKSLEIQLMKMGIFGNAETLEGQLDLDTKFKCLWADNGDDISIQYSGTPALKGDFVRYGRRTASGLVQDGFSALGRYYFNNFKDGLRQDAMDLVAGHYVVERGSPSPFQLNGFESFAYLPVASAFLVTGVTLTTLSVREGMVVLVIALHLLLF
ncbi:hypothetical protein KC19_1G304000 [Ceratodon purpureus]|uniref:SAC domain-containing protein n=1 Tax=Ceratodon purpureus TaxID=3225 RepID=A0A8T0JEH4_CERPU|nr:hypothetical protein KC19_1G304000 [Ceratodon purpureus]